MIATVYTNYPLSIPHCLLPTIFWDMINRRMISLLFFAVSGAALFSGCAQPKQPLIKEAAIATPMPTPQTQDRSVSEPVVLPPPRPSEVREVIERVYREAVTVYAKSPEHFITGDFNGDLSQDVAIVVIPGKGRLADINSNLANWIIGDAQPVTTLVTKTLTQPAQPTPVKVEPNDLLLAVIHGYGPAGWRDPQARQTYLLRNAVGSDMELQPLKTALNAATDKRKLPRLRGDVIMEKMGGRTGFLYWTGAKYTWYPRASPDS
jgi:hypothetical protein